MPYGPEDDACDQIDTMLQAAGWAAQDYDQSNLGASLDVPIREFLPDTGSADYLLFVDWQAVGVIEAKP